MPRLAGELGLQRSIRAGLIAALLVSTGALADVRADVAKTPAKQPVGRRPPSKRARKQPARKQPARKQPARRAPAAPCQGANLIPSASNTAVVDAATLCLINQVRAANRLRPLRANRELQAVATGQAEDMVRENYFGDDSPSGQTPAARIASTRYPAHAARLVTAQNIGWGTESSATPAGMLAAWLQSPPHREVILTSEYRDAGVGVAPAVAAALGQGTAGGTYAVEFGARGR
jgi:uncharacterized protein YkwD